MDRSGKLWILTPWAKFPNPNLVDRSGTLWVRFSKNRCYKNLIYFICVSWYFIESSIRCARTVHKIWVWKICPWGWNPKCARTIHFTLLTTLLSVGDSTKIRISSERRKTSITWQYVTSIMIICLFHLLHSSVVIYRNKNFSVNS